MDVTLPQCQQEPAAAGQREAEASCLHKTLEAEKHVVEETLLPSQNVSGNVTSATSRTYSQREEPILDPETNANQTGKDKVEIPTVEFGRSSSQRHKESPQNILPACVLALGSCASASSEKKENFQFALRQIMKPNNMSAMMWLQVMSQQV